jgi:ribosomal protein S18 acetylase RimI-like enzyme
MKGRAEDLADANLLEAIREHARWQGCECVEDDGVTMLAGPNAFPITFRNCVVRTDARVPAAGVLERARDYFAKRGRGYTVLARARLDADIEQALKAGGLSPTEAPCMLIESPVAEPAIADGLRVERFSVEAHIRHAVQINEDAYEAIKLPAAETRVFFARRSALLSSRVIGFVAYRGAVPVSTALTILSGDGAGVYWVGTASFARRSGLADVCTRLATNAGFASGARVVTLQASAFGEPLYRRLGYRTYDRLLRFRCGG